MSEKQSLEKVKKYGIPIIKVIVILLVVYTCSSFIISNSLFWASILSSLILLYFVVSKKESNILNNTISVSVFFMFAISIIDVLNTLMYSEVVKNLSSITLQSIISVIMIIAILMCYNFLFYFTFWFLYRFVQILALYQSTVKFMTIVLIYLFFVSIWNLSLLVLNLPPSNLDAMFTIIVTIIFGCLLIDFNLDIKDKKLKVKNWRLKNIFKDLNKENYPLTRDIIFSRKILLITNVFSIFIFGLLLLFLFIVANYMNSHGVVLTDFQVIQLKSIKAIIIGYIGFLVIIPRVTLMKKLEGEK